MTPDLKFSVIIPVHNRAREISRAVRSVLSQEYPLFEIIVVDDGSTDDTAAAVKAFTDKRVRYIYQENRERGAARNAGTNAATGDFVTFLDSDDEFLPGHLAAARNFISNKPGFDVYCTSYKIISPGKILSISMKDNIRYELIHGNFLSCNGVFLPKKTAAEFPFNENREMSGLEDWELWLRIAAQKTMTGSNEFTSRMNQHNGRSVLHITKENLEKKFSCFYESVFPSPEIQRFYRGKLHRLRASCETYMALHLAMTRKNRLAAIRHLAVGFFHFPAVIFTKRFYAILKRIP